MKDSIFLIILSLGLSACSTKVISDEPDPIINDSKNTLKFQVSANSFTRAQDDEIHTLHLAFFKSGTTPDFIYLDNATLDATTGYYSVSLPNSVQVRPDIVVAFANLSDEEAMRNIFSNSYSIDYLADSDENLIMSTAGYFDGSQLSPQFINHTPISETDFDSDNPIEITLDRIAAKVNVKKDVTTKLFTPDAVSPGKNKLSLTLEITNWDINATDTESFIIKQADTYSGFESILGFDKNWTWNNPSVKNLSWAKSVNYDGITDDSKIKLILPTEISQTLGSTKYAHESTRNKTDNVNSKPSVVLLGQYKNGEETMNTFYRLRSTNNDVIYTEAEYWDYLKNTQDLVYTMNEGSLQKADVSDFELIKYKTTSSDRFVTPQLKEESYVPDKYFSANGVTYNSIDEINDALYKRFNIIEKYKDGKCMFIIPIEHHKSPDGIVYGMVRNHSYTLTIKNISGFGRGIGSDNTPVSDETDPEIPDTYKVNTSLIVADWTEISQEIDISK